MILLAVAPIVIAHRGASGYLPEHTLAAYAVAALQGADFVEPDLVMTKDGVLVARHDNVLDQTTDVRDHPELADRRRTKLVDGEELTGFFVEDLTLAEIKTLRAVERIPEVRPENRRFDRQFEIPTLDEVIALVRGLEGALGRRIGLYPELKHPAHFRALGLPMEEALVRTLHRNGYRSPRDPVFVQCFEPSALRRLDGLTRIRLVQLLRVDGGPADASFATWSELATAQGLRLVAEYADGVGPEKALVIPRGPDRALAAATSFVADAHAAGLLVHPWTFRAEAAYLPAGADADVEMRAFVAAGVDGLFTDHPEIGARAVGPR